MTDESKQPDHIQCVNGRVIIEYDMNNHNNLIKLSWKNYMILSKQTVSYIISQIEHHLSLKQYGLMFEDENISTEFINKYVEKQKTINDEKLHKIPKITLLIKSLNASLWRVKSLNSSSKINQILSSPQFERKWNFNNLRIPKDAVNKWIKMSIDNGVPPFVLLQKWMIKQDLMQNNKEINRFLDKVNDTFGQMSESSFCGFCQIIAKRYIFEDKPRN